MSTLSTFLTQAEYQSFRGMWWVAGYPPVVVRRMPGTRIVTRIVAFSLNMARQEAVRGGAAAGRCCGLCGTAGCGTAEVLCNHGEGWMPRCQGAKVPSFPRSTPIACDEQDLATWPIRPPRPPLKLLVEPALCLVVPPTRPMNDWSGASHISCEKAEQVGILIRASYASSGSSSGS